MLSNSFTDNNTSKKLAIGIDLGTTNSCVSIIGADSSDIPSIITLSNGKNTLQSCVMLVNDKFIVGEEAYRNRYKTSNCVYSVKRIMGTNKTIVLTDSVTNKVRKFSPEEISAEILKALKNEVGKKYGEVLDCIITVPAYFTIKQKEATVKAGKLAGLNVLSLLSEPASSALAVSVGELPKNEMKVLVYDLGGGTFDVNTVKLVKNDTESENEILEMFGEDLNEEEKESSVAMVLEKAGNNLLGGDDLDREMFRLLTLKHPNIEKLGKEQKEKLILTLELFKKDIINTVSMSVETEVGKITISKEMFKKATEKIFRQTMKCVNSIDTSNLDGIILAGGSTKNLYLRELLTEQFKNIPLFNAVNPDEIVAMGAGIKVAIETKINTTAEVYDVLGMNIGIENYDGRMTVILNKASTLPCEGFAKFSPDREDQNEVAFEVYQGNSSLCKECVKLGSLIIPNIKGLKAFKVTLAVNFSGILSIKAEHSRGCEELELVNINALEDSNNVKISIKEKQISRWRLNANNEINLLIDEYEKGEEKLKSVIIKKLQEIAEEDALDYLQLVGKKIGKTID